MYALLVRWAADPAALAAWVGWSTDGAEPAAASLGAPCPLCGFPTYAWAPAIDLPVERVIQEDFPAWRSRDGACARCVEAYAVRREFTAPVGGTSPAW